MKTHKTKKGLSALCLVLALCMTLQSTVLAADISADTSADSSITAADTSADESTGTTETDEAAEAADEADEAGEADASTEAEPEADASTGEAEAEEAEEAAEPTETDEAEEAVDETEEAEATVTATAEEAEAVVTAQSGTDNGWAQVSSNGATSYWTFYYLESSTATTATKAVSEVLYVPVDCPVGTTTFQAGYYYFDANGYLVADGSTASVGAAEVLVDDNGSYVCDASASDSGKLVKVVATQTTGTDGAVTVSSSASYYTGVYNSLYYSNGSLYTGFYINSSTGVLYYMTNGTYVKYTGQYTSGTTSTYGSTTWTGDGLWYYNGSKFTGYVRRSSSDTVWVIKNGVGGTKLTGQMSTSTAYVRMDTGAKSTGDGLWYYQGSKFTGYVRRSSSDYVWVVKNGVGGTKLTGTMDKSAAYVRMDTGAKSTGNGKYYKNGVAYSGVVGNYYYKKGKKQTGYKNCWKTFDDEGNVSSKSSDNTYYFTSTGKVYKSCWKNLKRNGTTYRFYFNSDGTLCKNLYKVSSAWKKKATKLVISRSTHTATLYAKYGGSYKIPTKSFVISTSRSASNFKVGTYKLSQRKSWFTIDSTNWWYKWGTYISGSGSWCHSEQYYTKGNSKSLRISSYNNLGTNQSKQCIRMQVVNAKLIYDMRGYGSIKTVVLNKSSNKGPFGKMTITDNVDYNGKLSGTKGIDPTDPAYT